MKTLAQKNAWSFFLFITLILLLCAPLMYWLMEKYYAKDLDELITLRSDEFIADHLPNFVLADIDLWNKYNEDVLIVPYATTYLVDKPVQQPCFNKAEGHHIDYRILYREVKIESRPFILVSRIPMIEPNDLQRTLGGQYGVLFLILLISLTLMQRMMSRKLWEPFYQTLAKADSFKLEDGEVPLFEQTKTQEFARLNHILTKLMNKDLKAYQRQKSFVENASHEMQTPLAVFQSQLDMLMQQNLTQQQATTLESLYTVTARMKRLNKNLLLLAKIENAQFDDIQQVDFVDVLYTQLTYLRELAENSGIKVSVEIENELSIKANCALLESLINNLVVNAIRHNTDNGVISIVVKGACFTVKNTGTEQGPLDTTLIFQRFSRTSEKKKGNGLGLSIVWEICNRYGWRIEYSYVECLHHFSVRYFQ